MPPEAVRWDTMTQAQKHDFMSATVMPRMRALFVARDPHRYAKVTCATCHGRDGPARGYRMPNPALLLEPSPWNTGAAPPDGAPSEQDAFMARVIAPELGRLLGRGSGTAARAPEAGCFACHTRDE